MATQILPAGTPILDKAIEFRDRASTKWVETIKREPVWKMGLLERIKEIRTGAGAGGQILGGFGFGKTQRTQFTPPSPSSPPRPGTAPIKTYTAPIKTY